MRRPGAVWSAMRSSGQCWQGVTANALQASSQGAAASSDALQQHSSKASAAQSLDVTAQLPPTTAPMHTCRSEHPSRTLQNAKSLGGSTAAIWVHIQPSLWRPQGSGLAFVAAGGGTAALPAAAAALVASASRWTAGCQLSTQRCTDGAHRTWQPISVANTQHHRSSSGRPLAPSGVHAGSRHVWPCRALHTAAAAAAEVECPDSTPAESTPAASEAVEEHKPRRKGRQPVSTERVRRHRLKKYSAANPSYLPRRRAERFEGAEELSTEADSALHESGSRQSGAAQQQQLEPPDTDAAVEPRMSGAPLAGLFARCRTHEAPQRETRVSF